MDFSLSEEQRLLIETARRVGEDFGPDYWRRKDAAKAYPKECWDAICAAGLAGAMLPEAYGGSALGMVDTALIREAPVSAGAGSTLAQIYMLTPLFATVATSASATEERKRH